MGGGQLRVVGTGPRSGFVERPVFGRPGFIRRSGIDGDRRYAVVYRGYHYYGYSFYRPVPVVIYSPAYYGWAVQPWSSPVVIQMGFAQQPWYSTYGSTFVPYQQYQSADQWMTDQILAQNMQQAYNAGLQAGAQGSAVADVPVAPPTVSPELKQQFDAQVKQEIQEQGQQAQGGPAVVDPPPATQNEQDKMPDALKPGHLVFRVVAAVGCRERRRRVLPQYRRLDHPQRRYEQGWHGTCDSGGQPVLRLRSGLHHARSTERPDDDAERRRSADTKRHEDGSPFNGQGRLPGGTATGERCQFRAGRRNRTWMSRQIYKRSSWMLTPLNRRRRCLHHRQQDSSGGRAERVKERGRDTRGNKRSGRAPRVRQTRRKNFYG